MERNLFMANSVHYHALGFDNPTESITIFVGDVDNYNEWFRASKAKYCVLWGWYATEDLGVLPPNIQARQLKWADISTNGVLNSQADIDRIIHGEGLSQYQGTIGERITREGRIDKVVKVPTQYGLKNLLIFIDKDENCYKWFTSVKVDENSGNKIVGTVKEFTEYQGTKQTVLTRCKLQWT